MDTLRDTFWRRMRLEEADRLRCLEAVCRMYAGYHVEEHEYQGFCSYTWLLFPLEQPYENSSTPQGDSHVPAPATGQLIVQIRPAQHALDLDIAQAVTRLHLGLAPVICAIELHLPGNLLLYQMSKVPGTPLSHLLHCVPTHGVRGQTKQERLITCFAQLISHSFDAKLAAV